LENDQGRFLAASNIPPKFSDPEIADLQISRKSGGLFDDGA